MRRLLCILLVLTILLSFAGCHGSGEKVAFQMPKTFDTSKTYEISFWAKNDSNITQVNVYKKAIEDFQKLYPNITVNLKLYNDYGKIYNDVITNISTDTTPNVCITYPDHIATYLSGADTVVPLNDLMMDKNYGFGGSQLLYDGPTADEIVPQFLQECAFDGYYYAIPYMRSTEACYINKTLVEKLGFELPEKLTWDFIWEVSKAAMEKNEDGTFKLNGQKQMYPVLYKSTDNMMIQMLKQLDIDYSTSSGEINIFNEDTKSVLQTIAQHSKDKLFYTFLTGYPGNFLNVGQCLFGIDSTAGATWMGADRPSNDSHSSQGTYEYELVVMPLPQFNTENPKMISQGPSVCVFNKADSQEVLASWLFTQYLLTNEVQIAYAQTEGYVPVTLKAQNSDAYQDYLSRKGEDNDLYYAPKIEASQILLDNLDNTFVTPVFNGSASLRSAAGQMIEDVRKHARQGKTIDDAYFDQLFDETTALYRLDQIERTSTGAVGAMYLGKMPTASIVLLVTLAVCWVGIGVLFVYNRKKSKKQ